MKSTNVIIFLALLSVLSLAAQPDEATLLREGRAYFAVKNLPKANSSFATALAINPANQEANVLYSITRLMSLPDKPAVSEILDWLGISKTNRNVLAWKPDRNPETNGVYTIAKGFSLEAVNGVLRSVVLNEVRAAIANLEKVTPTFAMWLTASETGTHSGVVLDYGDTVMIRAFLRGWEYLILTLNSLDLDAQIEALIYLKTTHFEWIQDFMEQNPNFIRYGSAADLPGARQAFISFVDLYQEGSRLIRSRPSETTRLFNMDQNARVNESRFRTILADLKSSLLQPTTLHDYTNITVNLGRHFQGFTQPRDFLPRFHNGSVVVGTSPDPTFGGLVSGVTRQNVDTFLAGFLPTATVIGPSRILPDHTFEFDVEVLNQYYAIEASSNLVTWSFVQGVVVTNGLIAFKPPISASEPHRFYRVVNLSNTLQIRGGLVSAFPVKKARVRIQDFPDVIELDSGASFALPTHWPKGAPITLTATIEADGYLSQTITNKAFYNGWYFNFSLVPDPKFRPASVAGKHFTLSTSAGAVFDIKLGLDGRCDFQGEPGYYYQLDYPYTLQIPIFLDAGGFKSIDMQFTGPGVGNFRLTSSGALPLTGSFVEVPDEGGTTGGTTGTTTGTTDGGANGTTTGATDGGANGSTNGTTTGTTGGSAPATLAYKNVQVNVQEGLAGRVTYLVVLDNSSFTIAGNGVGSGNYTYTPGGGSTAVLFLNFTTFVGVNSDTMNLTFNADGKTGTFAGSQIDNGVPFAGNFHGTFEILTQGGTDGTTTGTTTGVTNGSTDGTTTGSTGGSPPASLAGKNVRVTAAEGLGGPGQVYTVALTDSTFSITGTGTGSGTYTYTQGVGSSAVLFLNFTSFPGVNSDTMNLTFNADNRTGTFTGSQIDNGIPFAGNFHGTFEILAEGGTDGTTTGTTTGATNGTTDGGTNGTSTGAADGGANGTTTGTTDGGTNGSTDGGANGSTTGTTGGLAPASLAGKNVRVDVTAGGAAGTGAYGLELRGNNFLVTGGPIGHGSFSYTPNGSVANLHLIFIGDFAGDFDDMNLVFTTPTSGTFTGVQLADKNPYNFSGIFSITNP